MTAFAETVEATTESVTAEFTEAKAKKGHKKTEEEGLEPPLSVLETDVLPLNYSSEPQLFPATHETIP